MTGNNQPSPASDAPPAPHRGFVVAGLGKMGIMHAAMLGAMPDARVAALVDREARLGDHVASMLGAETPHFTDLAQCLDAVHPEGVWIATPQHTHRALMEVCLERNVPVFCEKPMAHTLDDARAMAALVDAHPDTPVAVGFMLAHNPLFARARDWIAEGLVGDVQSYRAVCRLSQVFEAKKGWTFTKDQAGGGVLINSGCHLLYVLNLIFGRADGVVVRGGGLHNDVEDAMGALVDYDSGLWGTLDVTWSVPGHEMQTHDIEIVATGGVIEVGNRELRLWTPHGTKGHPAGWFRVRRDEVEPTAAFSLSPDYCGDEFYLEDRDFVEAVRRGHAPKVGVASSLAVQEWADALYRAMESGERVALETERS